MILYYLLAINLFSLMYFGMDKRRAAKGKWRIPEIHFFTLALLGGAAGIFVGMKLFRHKTKHKSFTIGIPFLLVLNAASLFYIALNFTR